MRYMAIFAKARVVAGAFCAILLASVVMVGFAGTADAEQLQLGAGSGSRQTDQSGPGPQVTVPNLQGGGSTLELPRLPQSQQIMKIPSARPSHQAVVIPSRQLRSQPGYDQVTVTVTGPQGGYVTGLGKDDFRLYMNGRRVPIKFFRQDLNTPVSIGILVDTSGSMAYPPQHSKLRQAQLAIAQFLRDLNPRDDVFLYAFSNQPFLLQAFTTNHLLVMRRLSLLHAWGQTALFDTIVRGLRMVEQGRYDKKALLVITDGMDNDSTHTVQQVIALARAEGVLIYSIGIGNPNTSSGPAIQFGPIIIGNAGAADEVDARTLEALSTETGAKSYIIREVGEGARLRQICASISAELREQYTLGFVAPDASAGGYRRLHVEVPTRPSASVRVRKGIDVGRAGWSGSPSAYSGPSSPSDSPVW